MKIVLTVIICFSAWFGWRIGGNSSERDSPVRSSITGTIERIRDRSEFPTVVHRVAQWEPHSRRLEGLRVCFSKWVAKDSHGALDWVRLHNDRIVSYAFVSQWARSHPTEAWRTTLAWAGEDPNSRATVIDGALVGIAAIHPDEVIRLVKEHEAAKTEPSLEDHLWRLWNLAFTALAHRDPETAFDLAQTVPSSHFAIAAVMDVWVRQDLESAMNAIDRMELSLSKDFSLRVALPVLSLSDPDRCKAYIDQFQSDSNASDAIGVLSRSLLVKDVEENWEWILRHTPESQVSTVLAAALNEMFWSDPVRAARCLALLNRVSFGTHVGRVLNNWDRPNHREVAQALVAELEDEDALADALSGLAVGWANFDPAAVLDFAQAHPDVAVRLPIGKTILRIFTGNRSLIKEDQAVLIKCYTLLGPEPHPLVTQSVVGALLEVASESAVAFYQGLPEGRGKDYAGNTLVDTWSHRDPEGAFNWIMTRPEILSNRRVLEIALGDWFAYDSAGAQAFLQRLNKGNANHAAFLQIASGARL